MRTQIRITYLWTLDNGTSIAGISVVDHSPLVLFPVLFGVYLSCCLSCAVSCATSADADL